jgi:hypothetical protein
MQHPDITLIFMHSLNAARNYLEERGPIPVFAYVLSPADENQLRRLVPKQDAGQAIQEIVERLRSLLKLEAKIESHQAVAIITEERLAGSDNGASFKVLQVAVDHTDAEPVIWHVPFHRVGERYEFGNPDGSGILKAGMHFIFKE